MYTEPAMCEKYSAQYYKSNILIPKFNNRIYIDCHSSKAKEDS